MRRIIVAVFTSLDGIMQAPGGPEEDPTGGFEFGATSTRSRSASAAKRSAFSIGTTPICSPLGPTSRTSGTRILSFVRGSLIACSSVP